MSVFDRLQEKLEVEKRDEGISPIEIASLPPNMRKIMRIMLREVEMTRSQLVELIENMPAADRMSLEDMDEALKTLSKQGWLICRGEGERINYQANLRRKAGSKLAQGIWSALDERIEASKKKE